MSVFSRLIDLWHRRSSDAYLRHLRKLGVRIGDRCIVRHPMTARIDFSRPSLITIGDNVDMNKNFQIMTHDWSSLVLRARYHDFINSSGAVNIGSNVYFGSDVIVLKGVTIGDNCVIAAGSVVTKSIPSNSVAAGVPCKVISTLVDYYNKRKSLALEEALEFVRSIYIRFGRRPYIHEMKEEFIYFVNAQNVANYKDIIPIEFQLGEAYDDWMKEHDSSLFDSFDSFVEYALKGIEKE